jgi:glycosyltransferase involved in cell wall biosynthesis
MVDFKVNVIINCYNGERYLKEALNSVYKQTYKNWTIIFLDNASTDRTQEIAESYKEKIHYIRNDKLVPLGEARNLALKHIDAELVAFLDSDDIWKQNKLEKQVDMFRQNDIGFSHTNYIKRYEATGKKKIAFEKNQLSGNIFRDMITSGYAICLSSVMVYSQALNQLDHLFNNRYQIVEEFDLFMRLFSKINVGYLHNTLVEYRIHDKMTTLNHFEKISFEKICVYEELFKNNYELVKNDLGLKDAFINKIQRNKALYSFINNDFKKARKEFNIIKNYSVGNRFRYYIYKLPDFILRFITPIIINQYLKKL